MRGSQAILTRSWDAWCTSGSHFPLTSLPCFWNSTLRKFGLLWIGVILSSSFLTRIPNLFNPIMHHCETFLQTMNGPRISFASLRVVMVFSQFNVSRQSQMPTGAVWSRHNMHVEHGFIMLYHFCQM